MIFRNSLLQSKFSQKKKKKNPDLKTVSRLKKGDGKWKLKVHQPFEVKY